MRVGIMSDSHGRVPLVRRAVQLLEQAGAEGFVHCGDVGNLEVLHELAGRPCWFVWGNTDDPMPTWRLDVEALGMTWPQGPLDLTLDGRRVAVYHGHEAGFGRAVNQNAHDYLFYGHSHKADDRRIGAMRVINPGALHRVATRTVALLDLKSDHLEFLEVDGV